MLGQLLLQEPWLAAAMWAVLYVSDYALTLWSETLYQRGADRHFAHEGSTELNPDFERNVAALRWVNPRFLLMWVGGTVGLLVWGPGAAKHSPGWFEFFMGFLIFPQCVICVGHFGNIYRFKLALLSSGIEGYIKMSREAALRVSAVDLLAMAGLFLFAFLLTASWWMAGGVVGCLYYITLHGFWLRRLHRQTRPAA